MTYFNETIEFIVIINAQSEAFKIAPPQYSVWFDVVAAHAVGHHIIATPCRKVQVFDGCGAKNHVLPISTYAE